jgi:hypothetical protein
MNGTKEKTIEHRAAFFLFYFFDFWKVTRRGEATKMEEYVPTITPMMRRRANSLVAESRRGRGRGE